MSEQNNPNQDVIDEFRTNGGKVSRALGGFLANTTVLLLTSIGAKSGQRRTTPLMYVPDGKRLVIVASKAGAPTNPDWYHNLLANPVATVEVGTERFQVRASVTDEPERSRLFAKMVEMMPGFTEYERATTRKIPVFALERTDQASA